MELVQVWIGFKIFCVWGYNFVCMFQNTQVCCCKVFYVFMQVSLLHIVLCVFSFCVLAFGFFQVYIQIIFWITKSLSLLLIVLHLNLVCIFFCFMFCMEFVMTTIVEVLFCCVCFHLCCLYYALGTWTLEKARVP